MTEVDLLQELAVIASLGVLVTLVVTRLKLPTVAGLLMAGALLGPYGCKFVKSLHAIELLAEVGVVMLLFTIGLEFSLARLKDIFRQVAVGGALQVGLTIAAAFGAARAFGLDAKAGLFLGFVFALSSTAIVLRALIDRRELDAPHGRFIVGTLIFQDLCVVPMVLIVPLLGAAASAPEISLEVSKALAKAVFVVVALIFSSRFVVPRFLALVDASRSREVFLLAVLVLCIGTAWLTSLAGLSLALGAFLGGMMVADTEFGHRAMGDILPLRDAFMSIFFVSLGMLFDYNIVLARPLAVLLILAGFLVGKSLLASIAALVTRFPARVSFLAGVGLGQFGEFGFVLANLGEKAGVVDQQVLGPLMAAGISSMFVSPVLMRLAPAMTWAERAFSKLERLVFRSHRPAGSAGDDGEAQVGSLQNHVLLVGFGVAGRIAASLLKNSNVPYAILEISFEGVKRGRAESHPIHYGDATNAETLEHFHLAQARALVLLINDPAGAQRVLDTARRLAPKVPILLRARYLDEKEGLMAMGATDVVAEEVEGSVEVAARLLRWCDVPRNQIDARLREVREATQTSERAQIVPRRTLLEHAPLADLKIESVVIGSPSTAVGRSALQLEVRRLTGALIVAVRRAGNLLDAPDPNDPFLADDVVYLVGSRDSVAQAVQLLGS